VTLSPVRLLLLILLVAIGAGVAVQLPELRRYVKVRAM
jgi:hypothetical protein